MKIISNFKDYYDSVIGYGVDKTIQYKRFTKSILFRKQRVIKLLDKISHSYDSADNKIKFNSFYVFFCNQLYIGYKVSKPKKDEFNYRRDEDIVYGADEVLKFFSDIKEKQETYHKRRFRRWHYQDWKQSLKRFEEKSKEIKLKDDWHINYQSPIIVIDYDEGGESEGFKVICNPQLNKIKFQKVKEPYTAFQEISMYISNIFGMPGNEMVEVSEKTKIEKHGFDKWSFRKMPKDKK